MEPQSPTVDRTSVRTQVRRILRAQVASGELQPGEIYSAVVLAKRLDVSATPVREAMLDLASAGLVEAVRNRGFRILTVSPQDLDEIVTLRIWLEVPAMQQVIERATDEEIDALFPLAQDIIDAAQRRDVSDFLLADDTFHTRLLQLARNDRLIRLVNELRGQTQLLGLNRLGRAGQLDTSAHEHVELLDAVRARDAATARAIMRRHLEHARGIWAGLDEADGALAPADAA
jgi:DNA-binding GntR family transcriptional regulator